MGDVSERNRGRERELLMDVCATLSFLYYYCGTKKVSTYPIIISSKRETKISHITSVFVTFSSRYIVASLLYWRCTYYCTIVINLLLTLMGALTGVLTGAMTGALTGALTGAMTGAMTGALTGVLTGAMTVFYEQDDTAL